MECNVGRMDRTGRMIVGVAALGVGLFALDDSVVRVVMGAAGAIMVATAVIGFCPVYRLFGIDSCHESRSGDARR